MFQGARLRVRADGARRQAREIALGLSSSLHARVTAAIPTIGAIAGGRKAAAGLPHSQRAGLKTHHYTWISPRQDTHARQTENPEFHRRGGEKARSSAVAGGVSITMRNLGILRVAILPNVERSGASRGTTAVHAECEDREPGPAGRLGRGGAKKPSDPTAAYPSSPGKLQSRHAGETVWGLGGGARSLSQLCQGQAGMGRRDGATSPVCNAACSAANWAEGHAATSAERPCSRYRGSQEMARAAEGPSHLRQPESVPVAAS